MERRRLLDIPSGYTLLNYIQSTGVQAIDTGVVYDVDDMEVAGTLYLPSDVTQQTRYPYISGICQRTSGGGRACSLVLSPDVSPMALIFSNKTNSDSGNSYGAFNLNTDFTFKGVLKNQRTTLYINGSQVGNIIAYTLDWSTCSHSLALFTAWDYSLNQYNVTHGVKIRLKNWQFKKQGTLIRDFVPVLNNNGVAGLYDLIEGVFYADVIGNEPFIYSL